MQLLRIIHSSLAALFLTTSTALADNIVFQVPVKISVPPAVGGAFPYAVHCGVLGNLDKVFGGTLLGEATTPIQVSGGAFDSRVTVSVAINKTSIAPQAWTCYLMAGDKTVYKALAGDDFGNPPYVMIGNVVSKESKLDVVGKF